MSETPDTFVEPTTEVPAETTDLETTDETEPAPKADDERQY